MLKFDVEEEEKKKASGERAEVSGRRFEDATPTTQTWVLEEHFKRKTSRAQLLQGPHVTTFA